MKRILVTGAGGSAGMNFMRSLRLADETLYIVGTDINKYHMELSKADVNYIVPRFDEPEYIETLNKIIEKEKIGFLHCQPDTELRVISGNREKIEARTFLPSKEAIRIALDKMEFSRYMEKNNIPVAKAFLISKPDDINFAIKKLSSSSKDKMWLRATSGAGSRASLPVINYDQALMWIEYWNMMKDVKYGEFMMSEFLPGKEFAFQSLWQKGRLITSQARERLEYVFGSRMPSGQSSSPTIARTVHRDDVNQIATSAIKILDNDANGIFCVDLKENSSGVPCVTEINVGRFFTTSIFFAVAGSNMPYHYIKMGFNEELPDLPKYNALPENLYWIRQIDCGEKLVREGEWKSLVI